MSTGYEQLECDIVKEIAVKLGSQIATMGSDGTCVLLNPGQCAKQAVAVARAVVDAIQGGDVLKPTRPPDVNDLRHALSICREQLERVTVERREILTKSEVERDELRELCKSAWKERDTARAELEAIRALTVDKLLLKASGLWEARVLLNCYAGGAPSDSIVTLGAAIDAAKGGKP